MGLALLLDQPWMGATHLILGHLAHDKLPAAGTHFAKGEPIARTGFPIENGGWFPHLHVQLASEEFFARHLKDLTLLDGYFTEPGHPFDLAPDPSALVGEG